MNALNPKITVLMAVYNDAEYLKYSVRSILNQTFKDFEFLIIDDGSTDNPEEVLNSFKDSRINYKKIKHKGLAGALNFGLSVSSGDWIARIDADDVNTKSRLSKQIEAIRMSPETDVISSWSVYFSNRNKIKFFIKTPEDDKSIKRFLDLHNPVNHSSVIFKKKHIVIEGGYNENFRCYEDFELWFRLREKLTFKILPSYLVYTRLRDDSLTKIEDKQNIYNMLIENAELNYGKIEDKAVKDYWRNILFWTEYFYGEKDKSRKYMTSDFTFKKTLAFLNTYMPDKAFNNITGLRLRYRLQSKIMNQKKYKEELEELIR